MKFCNYILIIVNTKVEIDLYISIQPILLVFQMVVLYFSLRVRLEEIKYYDAVNTKMKHAVLKNYFLKLILFTFKIKYNIIYNLFYK